MCFCVQREQNTPWKFNNPKRKPENLPAPSFFRGKLAGKNFGGVVENQSFGRQIFCSFVFFYFNLSLACQKLLHSRGETPWSFFSMVTSVICFGSQRNRSDVEKIFAVQ